MRQPGCDMQKVIQIDQFHENVSDNSTEVQWPPYAGERYDVLVLAKSY